MLQQIEHTAFARELCAIGVSTADVCIVLRQIYFDALQKASSNASTTRQSSMLKPEWLLLACVQTKTQRMELVCIKATAGTP